MTDLALYADRAYRDLKQALEILGCTVIADEFPKSNTIVVQVEKGGKSAAIDIKATERFVSRGLVRVMHTRIKVIFPAGGPTWREPRAKNAGHDYAEIAGSVVRMMDRLSEAKARARRMLEGVKLECGTVAVEALPCWGFEAGRFEVRLKGLKASQVEAVLAALRSEDGTGGAMPS